MQNFVTPVVDRWRTSMAACGWQIQSSPKNLECQTELKLVLCQCAVSCPQQPSSTDIHQSDIPVLNIQWVRKRFLALHPTEALLSADVFHHLLHQVHCSPPTLSSLFMHHPKIYTGRINAHAPWQWQCAALSTTHVHHDHLEGQ